MPLSRLVMSAEEPVVAPSVSENPEVLARQPTSMSLTKTPPRSAPVKKGRDFGPHDVEEPFTTPTLTCCPDPKAPFAPLPCPSHNLRVCAASAQTVSEEEHNNGGVHVPRPIAYFEKD